MASDLEVQLAVRSKLLTLRVCYAEGVYYDEVFQQSATDFITLGFRVGMEAIAVGGVPFIVKAVSESELVPDRDPGIPEGACDLEVVFPSLRAWENVAFEPDDNLWFIEEDFMPGPGRVISNMDLDVEPVYVLRLYGIANLGGIGAIRTVGSAILKLFPAGSWFAASDGTIVRVKTDVAPFGSKVVTDSSSPAHAVTVLTIPLWYRSPN